MCARRNDGILRDHDDAILDSPIWGMQVRTAWEWADDHIRTNASVLVNDGTLNMTVRADANRRLCRTRGQSNSLRP